MINFDAPSREVCTVRVSRTNTPLQALNLMNDVTFLEASRKLAERMIREGGAGFEQALRHGMRLTLARAPKPEEAAAISELFARLESYYAARPSEAETYLQQGESPRDRKIPPPLLAAWTGVASLLLNLDETVTKE
jgi:hypothetical protein